MLFNISNKDVLAEMDKHVIGHEKAKKLLITLVNRSFMNHKLKYADLTDTIEKMNLLLIGGSGTGKTYMLEVLSKIVGFPLVKIDASRLNPASNSSYSVQNVKQAIVDNAREIMHTEPDKYFSLEGTVSRTVVFMDEFDKLALDYGSKDAWNQRTQAEILTLVEAQDEFKDVSFVFAGAFTNLRDKDKYNKTLGFTSIKEEETTKTITEKDLIENGIITELMGRISAFSELDVLTYDTMSTILETQLIPKKIMELSKFVSGLNSRIDKSTKDKIINDALESGQGVRHMKRMLNNYFLDQEFNYDSVSTNLIVKTGDTQNVGAD